MKQLISADEIQEKIQQLGQKLNTDFHGTVQSLMLLLKEHPRELNYFSDYFLFKVGEPFVVGYGMDFNERHRELPGIYTENGHKVRISPRWLCCKFFVFARALYSYNVRSLQTKKIAQPSWQIPTLWPFSVYMI